MSDWTQEDLRRRFPYYYVNPYAHYSVSGLYIGNLSLDAPEARETVSLMKDAKIRAKTAYSPYEGHRIVLIHVDDLKRAAELMDAHGGTWEAREIREALAPPKEQWKRFLGTRGMEERFGKDWEKRSY